MYIVLLNAALNSDVNNLRPFWSKIK